MIEIKVTDPAKTPAYQLAIVIGVLQAFHDGEAAARDLANRFAGATADAAPLPPVLRIAAEDRPDAGADIVTATEAFGSAGATEAFGAAPVESGNVPAAGSVATSAPTLSSLPPAAPSAPSAAGVPAPAAVELDTDGLPWDHRIHASTKGKNQDGRWKAKRGVDPALVTHVQGELRALMSVPAPAAVGNAPAAPIAGIATAAAISTATPTSAPASVSAHSAGNAPTGAPATPPVPVPPMPPAPPAPAGIAAPAPAIIPPAPAGAAPSVTFPELAGLVGQLIPAGKLTQEKLTEICSTFGIANFGLMFNRPDLVPGVHAAIVAATGV